MTDDEKIKIEPDFNRAIDLWRQDKSQEAIDILSDLNNKFSNQPAIIGMLSAIYFTLKDWSNSLKFSEQSVKLSPKSERASLCLFHSLWNHERFDDAFEEAKRFIKLNGWSEEYDFILKELNESKSSD